MQKFNKKSTIAPCTSTNENCLICLSSISKSAIRGILQCGHSLFCVQCILGWAEVTIVIRFWIIAGLSVAAGLGLFYAQWVTS